VGDPGALCSLGVLRERAGDRAGAEAVYRQASDRGDTDALHRMAGLREQARDPAGANRVRRFGLTDDGAPATFVGLRPS